MTLTERIKSDYPGYNKTRRKLADFILDHAERCSMLTLKEIAQLSGVTQVTVLSFCRDMGYRNYAAFRQELQGELIARIDLHERLRLVRETCAADADCCAELTKFAHQMIDATCVNNGKERMALFAKKIADAKRVFITGHNATEAPARAMTSCLVHQGIDARFLDNQNKDEVYSLLTALPAEDCLLVAYGITPVGASTLSIARFCAKLNMETVCVTDTAPSPLNELASVSLVCSVRLMNLFNSMFTVFLMNDVIALFLFMELDARRGGAIKDDSAVRALFPDYDTLTWSEG